MTDIDLYEKSSDKYEAIQMKRPDYSLALKAFYDLAQVFLKDKGAISIADFCCGMGNNTRTIADRFPVKKATLIDINKDFLEIAKGSGIKALEVETMRSDILEAELKPEYDLVISMFAYHHVSDGSKKRYIEAAKRALKADGILLLGEIYSPNKETTLKYYSNLLQSIDLQARTKELEEFLVQTAHSDNFEYKVSREFAHDQLSEAGFVLVKDIKVWPTDSALGEDVGTFVEVWKLNK